MKVVILAGGLGTRFSEETNLIPKPMIEIGGMPILWHIMKIYHSYGLSDFIICCGYKGYVIKEYFANYRLHMSDITIDESSGDISFKRNKSEGWRVTLVNTGELTMTGGRMARIRSYLDDQEDFCMTYGDGLANIDIGKLINFHKSHSKLATVTAVRPPSRFGVLQISDTKVNGFTEKPLGEQGRISGGFFVLKKGIFDYLAGDDVVWEEEPMMALAKDGELNAYKHDGFWQPMDTLRDHKLLAEAWGEERAPWKCWT